MTKTWSGGLTGSVSRTFTNSFELNSESVNGANPVTFGYDEDRLLTSAGALTITRDATNGLVTGTTLGSTTEAHQYNPFGEPTRQTSSHGSTQLFDVQTTRDNLGRITQRIETFPEITRTFHYGYDLAGRLQTVTRDGVSGQVTVAAYTYDGHGNRLTAEGEAYGGGAPITATYDAQDRLLTYGTASYTYTANGELATKTIGSQITSYAYDTLGNLVRVTLPNTDVITYTVDGRGRRVAKALNGTRVKGWLYADQLRPIAELDGNGNLVSRFVYGTKPNVPEYIVKNGTTYRVFSDLLGSPRVIVDATTGAIVQRMDFHAFGEILQDSNPGWQPFGFAGGHYDESTGLVRFGVRDYDPSIGRWTAKDPVGFQAADTSLYNYVGQSPTLYIDPSGTFAVNLAAGAFGAIAGGVGGYLSSGGTWQGALTGAITGGLAATLNPISGVAGVLFEGGAASALSQMVSNYMNCEDLFKIDPYMVLASSVGSLAGNKLGKYMADPFRSAFSHDLFEAGFREPAWLNNLGTSFLEGLGSAFAEVVAAGDIARAQRFATSQR